MEHLKSQIDQYVSGRHVILVLYIQLKRLKSISGDLEHTSLTALLQEVTNRLHQFVGDQGLIARLSNHEFALVHTGFSAKDPFQNMAEDLVSALAKPYMLAKMPFYCGACIGGALYPGGAFDACRERCAIRLAEARRLQPRSGSISRRSHGPTGDPGAPAQSVGLSAQRR